MPDLKHTDASSPAGQDTRPQWLRRLRKRKNDFQLFVAASVGLVGASLLMRLIYGPEGLPWTFEGASLAILVLAGIGLLLIRWGERR